MTSWSDDENYEPTLHKTSLLYYKLYFLYVLSLKTLGSEVVLGPNNPVCFMRMKNGIPVEQAVERQRLRPGSGFLSVKVTTDGPTRVLQITDIKHKVLYKTEVINDPLGQLTVPCCSDCPLSLKFWDGRTETVWI